MLRLAGQPKGLIVQIINLLCIIIVPITVGTIVLSNTKLGEVAATVVVKILQKKKTLQRAKKNR